MRLPRGLAWIGLIASVACSAKAAGTAPATTIPASGAPAIPLIAPATTVTSTIPSTTTTTRPAVPGGVVVSVIDHGAVPNDDGDDQSAIQRAIDAAPEGATVVFPAGTYRHSDVLNVRTKGVTLWGYGATVEATDPMRNAIILRGDKTTIAGFTLVDAATVRRSAEEQMAVSVHYTNESVVRDNTIRGASSAGIFVWGASNYAVLNNTVENTMSDGIHSVGGANNGLIEANTLRGVGDDCVAVVSYISERAMSHNITIRNNSCERGKARGVSVVGGTDVVIEANTIVASGAAGIYLASEPSYDTYAAKRVKVIANRLVGVNTNAAIRHGAIFIWGRAGSASTSDGTMYTLQNEDLLIKANTIIDTAAGAADIVAQGSYSYRVNVIANVTSGLRLDHYIELQSDQYNLVGELSNTIAVADHVGNPASLP